MTPQTITSEPAGGDGLMAVISAAVIVIVGAEAAFVAYGSWLLLPLIMLAVILAAIGVIFALVHMIDNDTPFPTPPSRPVAEPEPTPAPIRSAALAGR